jgi:hypothetical protein
MLHFSLEFVRLPFVRYDINSTQTNIRTGWFISAKTKTATGHVERTSMDVLRSDFGFEIQSGLITVLNKWMRK